jgi:glutamyl-tRNA synthetase
MDATARGRYAPSPTGPLHLGNVRTALLAWLDARALGGAFVLRMEDLDPQRSSGASAAQIAEDLRWLGLDWDEGPDTGGPHSPYEQSSRASSYEEAVRELVSRGLAFPCTCTRAEVARAASAPHAGEDGPRYPGTCREGPRHPERLATASVRLRVEPGEVAFADLVVGAQAFDVGGTVGDFVVRRADGVAAYQLAVAYDDAEMRITRVVRGGDLLASTSRQLLVYRALGRAPPAFAHVPLMVGDDGHRLAKRGGALSVAELRARGVTPERLVGFLAGTAGIWDGRPVAARELVAGFALGRVARAPAVVTERDIAALVD